MKNRLLFLQILGWTLAFIFFYVYLNSRLQHPFYSLASAVTSFASYVVVIYGYSYFLYPRLYRRVSLIKFLLIVVVFFAVVLGIRLVLEVIFVAPIVHPRSSMFNFGPSHLLYGFVTSFLALITGILLTSVSDNIGRTKREAELKRKQAESELNLLKAQIQPHFLFNSLNNLYYDIYKILPEVAERISMLSNIMRYYMQETRKTTVPLSVELDFIKNYIELEMVRLVNPPAIKMQINSPGDLLLPPMLLMPFVENFFKHGVNREQCKCQAKFNLQFKGGNLLFTFINSYKEVPDQKNPSGVGLSNLRERLNLLYGEKYSLLIKTRTNVFFAQLIIPIDENTLHSSGR